VRELRGRRALITGAAGGIGSALATTFAREGMAVVLADLDDAGAERIAAELRATGAEAAATRIDVTDDTSIAAARAQILADVGPVDLIVNNAGIVHGGAFGEGSMAAHRRTTGVNLDGTMAVTHAFLDDLVARPEAHIVNVVSASAFLGLPFGAAYAASKWGALGFSESLRLELRQLGLDHVSVTAICPSYVDTGMFDGVTPPRLTRMLTPDELATATLRAIRRNVAVARIPWLVRFGGLRSVLPTRVFDLVARAFGIDTSMRGWKGH